MYSQILRGGLNILRVLEKRSILKSLITLLAYLSATMSIICLCVKTSQVFRMPYDSIDLISAKFIFPRGTSACKQTSNTFLSDNIISKNQNYNSAEKEPPQSQNNTNKIENTNTSSLTDVPEDYDEQHSQNENTYKIIESQFGAGGIRHENFYVKNSTNFSLNIPSELAKHPDVKIADSNEPQVLIVHTHTSESYMKHDSGFFYESYYPRSTDNRKNVTRVGDAITEKLVQSGINTIHDTTYHDVPSYNGSYSRSAQTIKSNLEKYPSIQVVLDIHRDSLGNPETGKIKPTFKFNGKKAAQIMIIAGCDKDGSIGFPDWQSNLCFALRLQQKAETMFPGITRPLNFNSVKYNMNLSHGSLLIEVGSDANTIDEAVYTGSLLGDALAELLKSLK